MVVLWLGVATEVVQAQQVKWQADVGARVREAPALGLNGAVYVAPAAQRLVALAQADGRQLWQFAAAGRIAAAPAVDRHGAIYVSASTLLYCVAPDGREVWRAQFDVLDLAVAVGAEGTVYAAPRWWPTLLFCLRDGRLKWTSGATGLPAIAADGTVLARTGGFSCPMGTWCGWEWTELSVVDRNGQVQWTERVEGAWDVSAGPLETAITTDGLYAASSSFRMRLYQRPGSDPIRPLDGMLSAALVQTRPSAPVIGHSGTIYFGDSEDHSGTELFYACVPDRASPVRWRLELDGGVLGAAVDAFENVYFGTSKGRFLAVGVEGEVRWELDLGSAVGIPALGPDGTIYVGTAGGQVFAIQGEAGPDHSAWPQYHRNAQHTGSMETYLTVPAPGQIELHGIPGRDYRIERAEAVDRWTVWTNLTLATETVRLHDPSWTQGQAGLYRAVLLP